METTLERRASAESVPTMGEWKKQPEVVADKVLKRAHVSKMAQRLRNSLALAQFKTKRGLEDFPLDVLEPKFEEELRRRRLVDGDAALSDSSSSSSAELPMYPRQAANGSRGSNVRGTRALMSSPLKSSRMPLFSEAAVSSSGGGHRKRNFSTHLGAPPASASFDVQYHLAPSSSSPTKRFRLSPSLQRSSTSSSFPGNGHPPPILPLHTSTNGTHNAGLGGGSGPRAHHISFSSPIKPKRNHHPHFTTSAGPNIPLFRAAGNGAHGAPTIRSRGGGAAEQLASSPPMPQPTSRPTAAMPRLHGDDETDLEEDSEDGSAGSGSAPWPAAAPATAAAVAASTTANKSTSRARHASPPRTPPRMTRSSVARPATPKNNAGGRPTSGDDDDDDASNGRRGGGGASKDGKSKADEGADLLLYLAASPSPAVHLRREPATPEPRPFFARGGNRDGGIGGAGGADRGGAGGGAGGGSSALPSSVMATPGGLGALGFPNTPGGRDGLGFDLSDFVNVTPSPAQKPWRTPLAGGRTPMSVARRRLTFDD